MAPHGYLALILHAHLPYVRHPEYEEFLEEDWLYEAIVETYLPLLETLHGLANSTGGVVLRTRVEEEKLPDALKRYEEAFTKIEKR